MGRREQKLIGAYDLALVHARNKTQPDRMMVYMPSSIARALNEHGYNRVMMTVDDDGIHLKPYIAADEDVQLPNWNGNG